MFTSSYICILVVITLCKHMSLSYYHLCIVNVVLLIALLFILFNYYFQYSKVYNKQEK